MKLTSSQPHQGLIRCKIKAIVSSEIAICWDVRRGRAPPPGRRRRAGCGPRSTRRPGAHRSGCPGRPAWSARAPAPCTPAAAARPCSPGGTGSRARQSPPRCPRSPAEEGKLTLVSEQSKSCNAQPCPPLSSKHSLGCIDCQPS